MSMPKVTTDALTAPAATMGLATRFGLAMAVCQQGRPDPGWPRADALELVRYLRRTGAVPTTRRAPGGAAQDERT